MAPVPNQNFILWALVRLFLAYSCEFYIILVYMFCYLEGVVTYFSLRSCFLVVRDWGNLRLSFWWTWDLSRCWEIEQSCQNTITSDHHRHGRLDASWTAFCLIETQHIRSLTNAYHSAQFIIIWSDLVILSGLYIHIYSYTTWLIIVTICRYSQKKMKTRKRKNVNFHRENWLIMKLLD
jgi:hypothetical protein